MKGKIASAFIIALIIYSSAISYIAFVPENDDDPINDENNENDENTEDGDIFTLYPKKIYYSTWNTSKLSTGSSADTQIILPLEVYGSYNFVVDWGDECRNVITVWNQTETNHTYASSGVYEIKISGACNGWVFNNGGDRLKLIEILQWGELSLGNSGGYFYGCENLNITATDILKIGYTNIMSHAFSSCYSLKQIPNMNSWDISRVLKMDYMFENAIVFNQSLSEWDVSNVMYMDHMFYGAAEFNGNVSMWDTGEVMRMDGMFQDATSFNQPLNSWDMSEVTRIDRMFQGATSFNQPLNSWNIKNVFVLSWMFMEASAFNQDIGAWNTSNVLYMGSAFEDATSFNQNLDGWDVSNSIWFEQMFEGAISFDQSIGSWDISSTWEFGMRNMFNLVTLSTTTYDSILIGWAANPNETIFDTHFHGGSSQYSASAQASHSYLETTLGWTITDGGQL